MIPSSDNNNSTGQGAATATADHPLIHLPIAKGEYDGKGKGGDGGESTGEGELEMSNPMHLTGHLDPKNRTLWPRSHQQVPSVLTCGGNTARIVRRSMHAVLPLSFSIDAMITEGRTWAAASSNPLTRPGSPPARTASRHSATASAGP